MKHILNAAQFSRTEIEDVFELTDMVRNWFETSSSKRQSLPNPRIIESKWNWDDYSQQRKFDFLIGTVFAEPSTRTKSSFEAATLRLGGQVLPIDLNNSSTQKGESLEDTIKTVSQYVDLIVMRTPQGDSAHRASRVSDVPIINAGAGSESHPTQALLDLYTIQKEKETIDDLKILFIGDLNKARTIIAIKKMFQLYRVETRDIDICGDCTEEYIKESLRWADVVYMTRYQTERHIDKLDIFSLLDSLAGSSVQWNPLPFMGAKGILLHPLPRCGELSPEADKDSRACYWKQVKNGMYVRMALLKMLLGHFHPK
jgi:aspartate carbamoyltransferase